VGSSARARSSGVGGLAGSGAIGLPCWPSRIVRGAVLEWSKERVSKCGWRHPGLSRCSLETVAEPSSCSVRCRAKLLGVNLGVTMSGLRALPERERGTCVFTLPLVMSSSA
jgi:hypothetical protein